MPKVKLTDAAAQRLKAPEKGQIDYFDAAYPALALRVTSKGVRSWVYFGRLEGKVKRATLGRYPDLSLKEARLKAGEVAQSMRTGSYRPASEVRKLQQERSSSETLEAATKLWLASKAGWKGTRTKPEIERRMHKHVLPALGSRKLASITSDDIWIHVTGPLYEGGKVVLARRVHSHLHRLFEWARTRRPRLLSGDNPLKGEEKPGGRHAEKKRQRTLSDDELFALWRASGRMGYPFGDLFRLLALTGARLNEVARASWPEIQKVEAGRALVVPEDRFKANAIHVIPLSSTALQILEEAPRWDAGPFVLSTTAGEKPIVPGSKAKAELDKRMRRTLKALHWKRDGAPPMLAAQLELPNFTNHDIRRTVRQRLTRLPGVSWDVAEAVIGHSRDPLSETYDPEDPYRLLPERQAALEAWAAKLRGIVTPEHDAAVVPIRQQSS